MMVIYVVSVDFLCIGNVWYLDGKYMEIYGIWLCGEYMGISQ